jgi:hypothetical protein
MKLMRGGTHPGSPAFVFLVCGILWNQKLELHISATGKSQELNAEDTEQCRKPLGAMEKFKRSGQDEGCRPRFFGLCLSPCPLC